MFWSLRTLCCDGWQPRKRAALRCQMVFAFSLRYVKYNVGGSSQNTTSWFHSLVTQTADEMAKNDLWAWRWIWTSWPRPKKKIYIYPTIKEEAASHHWVSSDWMIDGASVLSVPCRDIYKQVGHSQNAFKCHRWRCSFYLFKSGKFWGKN